MEVCATSEEVCGFKIESDGQVVRGCMSPTVTDAKLCATDKCNRQIAGIYCFTCQTTDPNCVFSQHEGPFELCLLPNNGCYTRISEDNTAERGCANSGDVPTMATGEQYIFCNHSGLCNGATTKYHSCNFLQLNLGFGPSVEVPKEYWRKSKQQGWLFESCPDVEGLPACYLLSDFKLLTYGCTRDLTDYQLVSYQRGLIIGSYIFCDGHYCNALPELKDPSFADDWRGLKNVCRIFK